MWNDLDNWDKCLNQVLASYHVTLHFTTCETPFFLVCGRDPNLPLHQLLESMQWFLGDPWSGCLDLKPHHLALAIAKKMVDENRFQHAWKTTNCTPPIFKIGNRVYFRNKQPGKWDLKWRTGYRIVCIEHSIYYLHIENQATGKTRPWNVKDVVHEPPDKL